ncbi:putative disease resistance protein RGA3 [Senna tora]|uniref:Putative disease resistance protein RGA3 n=1 Tax=Senna tora TaxID=362788 RepID=A0A834T7V7_9FABA|nr:putative disease resistance protein RGA3 [Senna tora]
MAEALLGVVLQNLNSFVRDELATFWGVNAEIKRLTRSLELIQAVIVDAKQKEITKESINIWLQQLKDAAHVLDDILDQYSIQSALPHYNSGSASQVHCFSLSSFKPSNIRFRYRIGKRLKEIRERLDQIAKERKDYDFVEQVIIRERPIQVPEWRQTGFVVDQSQIYGRDGDKDKIVELLLGQHHDGLFVYPIVGLGGLGKTTLAQLVFNDPRVINHFGALRIWVCISDDFSVIRILQSVMESITSEKCDISNLATLQKKVQEELQNKRYLLVLDDVWNQDQDKWYQLRSVLECGPNGASVLVTTRDSTIASFMTTHDSVHELFKMHDLVHDLAQSVMGKECFVMKDGDITNLPRSTHHIGYVGDGLTFNKKDLKNVESLRTFVNMNYLSEIDFEKFQVQSLRVLSTNSPKLPSLSYLIHLSVDEAKGVNLIGKKELRVLSLSWDDRCESEIKPQGIDAEQVIEAVQPHSNLKKLEVCGYKGSHFPSWMKDVSCINNLVSLELEDCRNCVQLPALGKLPSLEKLNIHSMKCVKYMDDDECYDGVEVKAFRPLKTLSLSSMPNLERLLRREGGEMFPRLHKLNISSCPKLTLSYLPSVEELIVSYCEEEELVESISSLRGLKSLTISRCSKLPTQLKSLHAFKTLRLENCDELECIPEQVLEGLNSLRTLNIAECTSLKCLPEAIQNLTSLESLNIWDCPVLDKRCKEGSGEDWHKIQHIPNVYISTDYEWF